MWYHHIYVGCSHYIGATDSKATDIGISLAGESITKSKDDNSGGGGSGSNGRQMDVMRQAMYNLPANILAYWNDIDKLFETARDRAELFIKESDLESLGSDFGVASHVLRSEIKDDMEISAKDALISKVPRAHA